MRNLRPLILGLTFFFALASQVAVTPLGEQMDFFGHISYVCFLARTGLIPRPGALTLPAGIDTIQKNLPAPDQGGGERYKRWASLDSAQREELKREACDPANLRTGFSRPNYEAQHPPVYYWIISPLYSWTSRLPLDYQNWLLSLFSILLASLAIPAVYLIFEQVFGVRAGVCAALLVAWLPNYMSFLGRITNDCLSFPLFSWSIYLLVRKDKTDRHLIAALVLIATALFTKSYALTLLPLAVLGCWDLTGDGNRAQLRIRTKIFLTFFLALAVAALFFFNWKFSGHWLLLTEVRDSAHASLFQKIMGMLRLNPVWFYFNGLIRLFWWSGFWSLVSPGIYYYVPLAIFGGVAGYGLFIKGSWRDRTFWNEAFPHLVAVFSFIAAMAWHASLFEIRTATVAGAERTGNEGWYLLVIAPSIFMLLFLPIKRIGSEVRQRKLLQFLASGVILWNLLGRLSIYMFWSGHVSLHHFLRRMDLKDTVAAIFNPQSWNSWLSLPGIIHPVWLTSILPLLAALIASVLLLNGKLDGREEAGIRSRFPHA
jgi:hypothetical protein